MSCIFSLSLSGQNEALVQAQREPAVLGASHVEDEGKRMRGIAFWAFVLSNTPSPGSVRLQTNSFQEEPIISLLGEESAAAPARPQRPGPDLARVFDDCVLLLTRFGATGSTPWTVVPPHCSHAVSS